MPQYMRFKDFIRSFNKSSPKQPDSYSGEAYLTCYELPFEFWIKVTITKDVKYLLKSGELPVEQLVTIWDAISDEYRSLSKDIDTNHVFDLYKEVMTTDKDIILITAIVNQLRLRRNEELIDILRNGFNFHFKYVDLNADLDRTLTATKGRIMQLKLREEDYKKLNGANLPAQELTEFDFIEQLAVLSEDNGYHIRINTITVAEYVAIYNKFKAKVELRLQNER